MSGSQAPLGFGVAVDQANNVSPTKQVFTPPGMPDRANDMTRHMQALFDSILQRSGQANSDPNGGQNYLPLIQAILEGRGGNDLGDAMLGQLTGQPHPPANPPMIPPSQIPLGSPQIPQAIPNPDVNYNILLQLLGHGPGGRT
jgi:hypothetical protein